MNAICLAVLALVAAPPAAPSRLEQLVEANILGTHAFQVALAKKEAKGDVACYSPGSLTDAQLAALETHQAALMKADVKAVRAWAEGEALGLRPEGRPRAAPRVRPHAVGPPARQRPHALARRAHDGPARAAALRREPLPDEPRGRARRRPSPGALRLLCGPRPARLPRASSACRARTRTSSRWAASSKGRAAPGRSERAPPSGRSPGERTGTGARRTWASGTTRCWPGSCSRSRTLRPSCPGSRRCPRSGSR